ncbi:MAG: diversity-generating retroelement protein Avd [Armatimonadetes bacterium]|nr:MAG: diversity-generating retroelement protein Avd [Armatimonadota bacterium]
MPNFHKSIQDIPIFTKTYELYKIFYGFLPFFPKRERHTLGQRCEIVLLDILESIILAGSLSKSEKPPVLKTASIKVDVLKTLFKLGKDLKIIDNKKYEVLTQSLDEIGRMIGGWIKTTSQI